MTNFKYPNRPSSDKWAPGHSIKPRLSLNGFKGVDLSWGLTNAASPLTSAFDNYLTNDGAVTTQYSRARLDATFAFIQNPAGLDTNNILMWLFGDGFFNKAVGWGSGVYVPAFNANILNLDDFLTFVATPRGVRLILVIFPTGVMLTPSHAYSETHTIPVPVAPFDMDPVTRHGNLDAPLANTINDWWATGGGFTQVLQANTGGPEPSGCSREIQLVHTAGLVPTLRPPLVPITVASPKKYISFDVRGGAAGDTYAPQLNYYDANGVLIRTCVQSSKTPGVNWVTYEIGISDGGMPVNTAYVALGIQTGNLKTIYVGGMRVAPAVNSALTNDYLSMIRAIVLRYLGHPAVDGLVVENEGYAGGLRPVEEKHDFYQQAYNLIRSIPSAPPVGEDCFRPTSAGQVKTPFRAGNESYYEPVADFLCLHNYVTGGYLPDFTQLCTRGMEIIVGECGDVSYKSDALAPAAITEALTSAYRQGARAAFPFSITDGNLTTTVNPNGLGGHIFPFATGVGGVSLRDWAP